MLAGKNSRPGPKPPSGRFFAAIASAGVILLLLLPAGCGKKSPPPEVLFRYQFRPAEEFTYEISLLGEGEATMTMGKEDGEKEEVVLPVRMEGSYLMEIRVGAVSPEGVADLFLAYRDFDLTAVSRVRDREMAVRLDDGGMVISEGDRVIKETGAGESDFPLRGITGEEFEIRIDNRGTILSARLPAGPERLFPGLRFDAFLERMQPEFPREALPPGASWSRVIEVPGPGQGRPWDRGEKWSVELVSTFRGYEGRDEKTALIDFSGDYRQEAPAEVAGSGPRGSSHRLEGTTRFDLPGGRVLSSRSVLRQSLDVRIEFDQVLRGEKIDLRVEDTVEVTVQLRQ